MGDGILRSLENDLCNCAAARLYKVKNISNAIKQR